MGTSCGLQKKIYTAKCMCDGLGVGGPVLVRHLEWSSEWSVAKRTAKQSAD